jgi:HK97 family phage prohead protease
MTVEREVQQRENAALTVKAATTDKGTTRFIASTAKPDRYNDIIVQGGWKLDSFKSNPVILWMHNRRELPVGKGVDVLITEGALEIEVEWAPHDFAQQVKTLYDGEYLNAVSVGFQPLKYSFMNNGGVLFEEQELLELSAVTIPANPDALALRSADDVAVKAVDAWAAGWLRARGQKAEGELTELLRALAADVSAVKAWTARVEKEATDDLLARLPQTQRSLVERLHKQYGVTLDTLVSAALEGEALVGSATQDKPTGAKSAPVLRIKTA